MYLSFRFHIMLSVLFNKQRAKPFIKGQTVRDNRQVTDRSVTCNYRLMGEHSKQSGVLKLKCGFAPGQINPRGRASFHSLM